MQIDALVLQRAPQPFDEDVVEEPAAPIHGDAHALANVVHPAEIGLRLHISLLSKSGSTRSSPYRLINAALE